MPLKILTILPIITIVGEVTNIETYVYPVMGLLITGCMIIRRKRQ